MAATGLLFLAWMWRSPVDAEDEDQHVERS
jgi:hypothetical protein